MLNRWPTYCVLVIGLLLGFGCREEVTGPDLAAIAQFRSDFQLGEEPPGVVNVLDLREKLLSLPEEGGDAPPVVVVGKIGGIPNPWGSAEPNYPWVKGKARFFLADAAASMEVAAHTHTHKEGEECPFCANAARSDAIAVVRFLDDEGKSIRVGASDLFNLEKGQTVVVRGKTHVTGTGKDAVLILDADGVYVRK